MIITMIKSMMTFLNLNWKYYLMIGIVIVSAIIIGFLKFEVNSLENKNKELTTQILNFENVIKFNEENIKERIVYVDKEIKVIEEKVVEKIKYIKEYVYDNNKSKCENGINVIRSGGF